MDIKLPLLNIIQEGFRKFQKIVRNNDRRTFSPLNLYHRIFYKILLHFVNPVKYFMIITRIFVFRSILIEKLLHYDVKKNKNSDTYIFSGFFQI